MSEVFLIQVDVPEQLVVTAPGPQGATGPTGPVGASGGAFNDNIIASGNIPLGQIYSFLNPPEATTQTLPPISSVIQNGITNGYTITLLNDFPVIVVPSGSDLINGGASDTFQYAGTSRTYVATTSGWLKT